MYDEYHVCSFHPSTPCIGKFLIPQFKKMKRIFKLFLVVIFLKGFAAQAQVNYTMAPNPEFMIKGTSNVHDWEETVQKVSGSGSVQKGENGTISILSLSVKIECRDIKSSHGSIMDGKTYDALKADDHPTITYKLLSPISNIVPASGTTVVAKGQLTIAGVTKPVDLQVKIVEKSDGTLTFQGTKKLKMTDFNVSPPTAFMGAMKVGDEVELSFAASIHP